MTKEEKAQFHLWLRKELQYWKKLFGLKSRILLRLEPKFASTSTMMMLVFDAHQSTILYNPDILTSKRVTVMNYLIHELIHNAHNASDAPLFEYAEKNESFKSVYAESSKQIETFCDRLAAVMVKLDGEHGRS